MAPPQGNNYNHRRRTMRRKHHIKFNRRSAALALFGLLASTGIGLMSFASAEAISPTVTATFMDPVGTTSLQPGEHAGDAGNFYVPVKIDMQNVASLSISINAATADLVGTINNENKIASVPSNGEYTIGQMNNQWGYRWNLADEVLDTPINGSSPKNYQQMPTTPTSLGTMPIVAARDARVTKYLTLGFGVGVNGTTPADTYTNEITVSVVATPRGVTIFDISTMQEMTTDICHNTTTPTTKTISTSADINVGPNGEPYTDLIDTTGDHQGDGAYVPQKELTDTRDGKKYTIRKLADGNCWMVSNLEFDLVPTTEKDIAAGTTPANVFSTTGEDTLSSTQITLTNTDTDLNSITTWTPAIAAELYGTAGTVYRTQRSFGKTWSSSGNEGLRSFSSMVGYPDELYSTKTASTPTFDVTNDGKPWQRFGNQYNYTAATLGSGTKITTGNAADSVCPKGWKLPLKNGGTSFSDLLGAYGLPTTDAKRVPAETNKLANFPLNFLRTGRHGHGDEEVSFRKYVGLWWSATRGGTAAYHLYTTTLNSENIVSPQDVYYPGYGAAIRCVAR